MSVERPPGLLLAPQQQQHWLPQRGFSSGKHRSLFATAKQKAAPQQQKEQQLETDRAKLLQAKAEQAERQAQEAAMKRQAKKKT